MGDESYAKDVIQRARDTLATAKHGFDDLVAHDRSRRMTGLRNLITFGRSVTFVLQNMRGHVAGFDDWYKPEEDRMRADVLMRYFVEARNNLEKQGRLSVSTVTTVATFTAGDLSAFGPPPPRQVGAFIGDRFGGSGWQIEMPDGSIEKYYVALPESFARVTQHFSDFPEAKAPELAGRPIEELCEMYLQSLEELLQRAEARFLPNPQPRGAHLRRVK